MTIKLIQKIALILVFLVISCEEPETVVTNIVHSNGSVTRRIEMRNVKNNFNPDDFQVPFDSTWILTDSVEINDKGDTAWVKRAEKLFSDFNEINSAYMKDSGANKSLRRHVMLTKKFRWFNTEFRFSEHIEKKLDFGYPLREFLSKQELEYLYSPENLVSEKLAGPDSLKFRQLKDSVDSNTEEWLSRTFISGWIYEFGRLVNDTNVAGRLRRGEHEIIRTLFPENGETDSLWNNGIILKRLIGEVDALKYRTESDSADKIVTEKLLDYKEYTVRIVMPGKLTSTNGFIDRDNVLLWPVKPEYFLTQPYEMSAVSKVRNYWAWVVSLLFVLFVLSGIVSRSIRKG